MLKEAVKQQTANPLTLASLMDEATSREWRDWLPETVREFVKLGDSEVQQLDKLMAVQVALTNPDVFETWPLFLSCVVAFNHRRVNFEWLDKPSILELAWGCTVLNKLAPGGSYGPEVLRCIGAAMIEDGLVFFPWTGGDGYALGEGPGEWAKGLIDEETVSELVKAVRASWRSGELTDLEPSEVSPTNAFHVQLRELVAAQSYIKEQQL